MKFIWRADIGSSTRNRKDKSKGRGKANQLQVWRGPEGSRRFRLPEFVDKQQMKVVRLSVLRTGCLYLLAEAPGTDIC